MINLSIQFEKGLLVQTYRYRSGPKINSFSDLEKMVTGTYLEKVARIFLDMENSRIQFLPKLEEDNIFDEII